MTRFAKLKKQEVLVNFNNLLFSTLKQFSGLPFEAFGLLQIRRILQYKLKTL